jgi:positive regulator of sigma E activity
MTFIFPAIKDLKIFIPYIQWIISILIVLQVFLGTAFMYLLIQQHLQFFWGTPLVSHIALLGAFLSNDCYLQHNRRRHMSGIDPSTNGINPSIRTWEYITSLITLLSAIFLGLSQRIGELSFILQYCLLLVVGIGGIVQHFRRRRRENREKRERVSAHYVVNLANIASNKLFTSYSAASSRATPAISWETQGVDSLLMS